MTHASEADRWADQLDDLCTWNGPPVQPHRAAPPRPGLPAGPALSARAQERVALAEAAGDLTPDGVQDFLARMHRDADAVRVDLRAYLVEHLGEPDAVLVLDETGNLQEGKQVGGRQTPVLRHPQAHREF